MDKFHHEVIKARKAVCGRISKAIRAKGMNQKSFALEWGRPESQVSNMLNGKVDMQLSTLTEIENILRIELIRKD